MCGIGVVVGRDKEAVERAADALQVELALRGPDWQVRTHVCLGEWHLVFFGCVLWIRGDEMQRQPVEDDEHLLCFNGQLYDLEEKDENVSDTKILFERLKKSQDDVGSCLLGCRGPMATLWLDKQKRRLFFHRSQFGQRSLVLGMPLPWPEDAKHTWDDKHALGHADNLVKDPRSVFLVASIIPPSFSCLDFACVDVPDGCVHAVDLAHPSQAALLPPLARCPPLSVRSSSSVSFSVLETLLRLLRESVAVRCAGVRGACRLLFSGGVDSLLLAILLGQTLPEGTRLYLRNVAWQTMEEKEDNDSDDGGGGGVAWDRKMGRLACETVRQLVGARVEVVWEEVDGPRAGTRELEELMKRAAELTHPMNTLMDATIGGVLSLAYKQKSKDGVKVCFSGLGADELFAGYARHVGCFNRGGFERLDQELHLEIARIGLRNGGRDDRVCGSFGLETRHPFLDRSVVEYAFSVPLHTLTGFEQKEKEKEKQEEHDDGEKGKLVLRRMLQQMGVPRELWNAPKKAMQFGSRMNHALKAHLGLVGKQSGKQEIKF